MIRRKCFLVTVFLVFIVSIFSFVNSPKNIQGKDHTINLRWIKGHDAETWDQFRTGLMWDLSFLGAKLPMSSTASIIQRTDSASVLLNLDAAGFDHDALAAFEVIIDSLQQSEEYLKHSNIDAGRFVMLTLNSSWHYYKITGAEPTLKKFIKKHHFKDDELFPVINSSVAKHNRLIRFTTSEDISRIAFIAEEGIFDTSTNKMNAEAFEVMDIMPNGQLRFAVYNEDGYLIEGTPSKLGIAGKPAKCLWCHETNIQIDFKENPAVGNFIGTAEFNKRINGFQATLDKYRTSLDSEIDFNKKQEHTYGEFLYLCFMEPSIGRLAAELEIDKAELLNKTSGMDFHNSAEFSFFKDLFHRRQVEGLMPWRAAAVPSETRETGDFEPNYFKNK